MSTSASLPSLQVHSSSVWASSHIPYRNSTPFASICSRSFEAPSVHFSTLAAWSQVL